MDINSPPPAEVIDLAAKFAEVARASNGDGHEGGLGAPEPLAQLTRSLDAWSRSVQQAVHGVRERAEAVEHRLEGIQYELHRQTFFRHRSATAIPGPCRTGSSPH